MLGNREIVTRLPCKNKYLPPAVTNYGIKDKVFWSQISLNILTFLNVFCRSLSKEKILARDWSKSPPKFKIFKFFIAWNPFSNCGKTLNLSVFYKHQFTCLVSVKNEIRSLLTLIWGNLFYRLAFFGGKQSQIEKLESLIKTWKNEKFLRQSFS